ncbi:MAG: ATPase central domain protein [Phycisphaerales bacterium]|nr:ATPase central domain protein [Phycisphaerales bacterium]
MVAEERAKQHHVLAERLEQFLNPNGNGNGKLFFPQPTAQNTDLFYEITPGKKLGDLILPTPVLRSCEELVEEHQRKDLLRSHNLEPRHRILLVGPPGNGKTSLAESIAHALFVPMVVVRYDGVIGSFLGETATRLRKVFDHVRTRPCVLFFDEFDTLGKERGDPHDTGEIKRVVSSLLLQIDSLPSHVVVATATNHPELLDRAVWRRFQLRLKLPKPSKAQVRDYLKRLDGRFDIPLSSALPRLADHLCGVSFSELEEFGLDVVRRFALAVPNGDLKRIARERLRFWQQMVKS